MAIISDIVPVYKVEQFLPRCVNSILSQSYSDFELILTDDGSPDSSGSMCDELAIVDERIITIHQKNAGLSAARNSGIELALVNTESEWISFIDSDDWVHPMYLQYLYSAAVEQASDISVCGYESTPGDNPKVDRNITSSKKVEAEEFYISKPINAMVAWGKLYRKELFRDVRYPVGKLHEDEFTTYKLLFSQKWIAWIDLPLYAYFQNDTGITQSKWNPRRMDGLEAQRQQIRFYEENGLSRVKEYAVKRYISEICSHYYLSRKDYPAEAKNLRRLLQRELRTYRDVSGLTIRDDFRVNYAAYPLKTKMMTYLYAIKKHIK